MPCHHMDRDGRDISYCHARLLLEEHRQCLRHGNECHAAANGHHNGLLHVLVAVLHLEIDVE